MPGYPELAPRSNQRLGAPATGNDKEKTEKQQQQQHHHHQLLLVPSQGISSSFKGSATSLSSAPPSRSSSEVSSSALRRGQSSSSAQCKTSSSSSSRRCMRKWVTIGDYEGEAIVEDDQPGNGDTNRTVEQRQEHCDKNGGVEPSVRLEKCSTKDEKRIELAVNENTIRERPGKSRNGTNKVEVETRVTETEVVNKESSPKKEVGLENGSTKREVALEKSSTRKEVELEKSSTRKEVVLEKSSTRKEVVLEKSSTRKEVELENRSSTKEKTKDNDKSDRKECNGIDNKDQCDEVTTEGVKINKNTTNNVSENNEKKSNKKKCLGKWEILGRLTIKSNGESREVNSEERATTTTVDENSSEEEMDAELPTPEHITSFYDLVKAVKNSNENLSPQEIENKFKQLSLAFKTDRLTLRQRLDVQQRQRDIAETNFDRELNQLKTLVLALHENCIDMELVDAIMTLRKHIDVITTSSTSLLSSSEVWGAVQQEWKVSRALEVLLLHVENVNRLYERDHQELEELRRLLAEHQIELPVSPGSTSANQSSATDTAMGSRRIRALSLAGISKQQNSETGTRRISLGPGASKAVLNNFMGTRSARRRASLMPDLRPFHQEFASVAAAAVAANTNSSKDKEEKSQPNNGMLNSSITEEGSESGDDGACESHPDPIDNKPSAAHLRRLTQLYGQALQESEQRSYEESNPSPSHTPGAESHQSYNPVGSLPLQQHWVIQWIDEFIGAVRDGQWPYTPLQTLRGAFTSFLLVLSVFYFILATSSASEEPEPCYPDWTVFVRQSGPRPT